MEFIYYFQFTAHLHQWQERRKLWRRYSTHALPLSEMRSYSCPSTPRSRGSGVDMEKLPMLRVSHCQTALFGKRGGGSGGGGLTAAGTSSREERSEAAEKREEKVMDA